MRQTPHPAGLFRGGFTLLELLVVIMIVGILASIALPNFSRSIEKVKVREAQSTLAAIASAERVYRLDQGGFGRLDTTLVADDLIRSNYVANPDPNNTNTDWDFAATAPTATTFTATATRTGGGAFNTQTLRVDQNFTGQPQYGGKIYDGSHTLRD